MTTPGMLTAGRLLCIRRTVVSLLVSLYPGLAFALDSSALPTGGAVAAGTASISQSGARLYIQQQSNRAILNWNTFNIGSSASVNFQQPAASSVILNRVASGGGVSEIYGSLTANGQVFLVNPTGTLFGRGAQVNVGGLVASSLDITNANFMNGIHRFAGNGTAGAILNQGTLTAAEGGYIALLAPQVRNEGVVAARMGTVAFGAGEAIRLDMNGTGLIEMQVEKAAVDALIANKSLVQADGGVVLMGARAAGQLAGGVINNSGEIHAARVTERDGVVRLEAGDVANSGSIVADGTSGGRVALVSDRTTINSGSISARGSEGKGGEVRLLGDKVGLFGAGRVDASGEAGGGIVLVGGNFQGKGPEQNASMTVVGPNASIYADAVARGDGGKAIVWSDDSTVFAGSLFARGGRSGGNGGFAEVSGKQQLDFSPRKVDLKAPNGAVGSLLLDPLNIIVATGGGAAYADVSTFGALGVCAAEGEQILYKKFDLSGSRRIDFARMGKGSRTLEIVSFWTNFLLLRRLLVGTTQTIDPSVLDAVGATVFLQASNDITVNNSINLLAPGAGLIANAGNNINVNASVTTNNGPITLSGRAPGGTQTPGGTVNLNAGGNLNSTGGAIMITNNSSSSPITLGAVVNAGAGAVTLNSGAQITETGSGAISTTGTLMTMSTIGQTLNGPNTVSTFNASNFTGSGAISLTNTAAPLTIAGILGSGIGNVTINNTGAISITGIVNAIGAGSNVSLTSTGTITESGAGLVNAAGTLTTNSVGGQTLNAGNTVGGFAANNASSGNIAFTNIAGGFNTAPTVAGISILTLGAITNGIGSVSINNTGSMVTNGTIFANSTSGSVALTASGPSADIIMNSNLTNMNAFAANAGRDIVRNTGFTTSTGTFNATAGRDILVTAFTTSAGLTSSSMSLTAGRELKLQAGTGTSALAFAYANVPGAVQTVNASTITIQGGAVGNGNYAGLFGLGTQNISASSGITIKGGLSGGIVNSGNYGEISTTGNQTVTVGSGGLTAIGGGGAGNTDNHARVYQYGLTGSQTINVNGGGSIVLTGGSSGLSNVGGIGHGSRAAIDTTGPSQVINFNAGGGIVLTGGSAGSRAFAMITSENGSQTITGSPTISLTGGAGGGIDGEGNYAQITAKTSQTINASTIVLTGGGAGTENSAGIVSSDSQTIVSGDMTLNAGAGGIKNAAFVQAPAQNITVRGNIALNGGGSASNATNGGGAGLGGRGSPNASATNLALTVDGNLTMNGGASGAAIGSGFIGGQVTDMTINVGGNVVLDPGSAGVRIGTPSANIAGGNISITAGGSIALNDTATVGTDVRTLGNVTLKGASISEGTNGKSRITASALTTTSTSGATALNTLAVASLNATSAGALNLGQGTITGALSAFGNGAVTETGALTVGGPAIISAGAAPITLATTNNAFTGAISLNNSGANNVTMVNNKATIFGASNVGSGTFSVISNGAITQTGAITQAAGAGTASFIAGANPITLTQANDFTGTVLLSNSGLNPSQITDANTITFANMTLGGNLRVNAPTIIAHDTTTNGDQVWNGSVTFNSTETTNGGTFTVTGTTTLGNGLTVNSGSGNVTFQGNVNGSNSLVVNSSGFTTFSGSVSSSVRVTVSGASNTSTTSTKAVSSVVASTANSTTTGGAASSTTSVSSAAASTTSAGAAAAMVAAAGGPAPAPVTAASSSESGTTRLTESSGVSKETIRQIDQQISQARAQMFSPALDQLSKDPSVADVPECRGGGQAACVKQGKPKKPPALAGESDPVIKRKVALLFGNDRYLAPIPGLQTPIRDVEEIGKVLKEQLGYEVRVIKNASKTDIVNELNNVVTEVDEEDSVFVYYAGHGYQADKEKGGGGYWIPVDANNSDASSWISNTAISKFLANMASRQVMLVSDSCYSGTLAQEQKVSSSESTVFDRKEILRKRSVLVMSSGGNEPVSDGGHDNHSLFAYHFLRNLKAIDADLVGGDIHQKVRTAVAKEYPQDPQYGAVVSAGHSEGGEYLIVKK